MKCKNCIYFSEEWEKTVIGNKSVLGYEEIDVIVDYCYALPEKVNIDNREQRACLMFNK